MSDNTFTAGIRTKAGARHLNAALPDAEDVRVLHAATTLRDHRIAQPILVGNSDNIRALAAANQVDLAGVEIADPHRSAWREEFIDRLFEKRKAKGMTREQA